jgi:elongator complex protein 2
LFLYSQTTRLFTCWERDGEAARISPSWHEIARPQVHGHDLNCVAVIQGPGNHRYVSGADEKVARVFEAPGAFLDSLYSFTGSADADGFKREDVQIVGANMSSLGLSQKPIYTQGTALDVRLKDITIAFGKPHYKIQCTNTIVWN